MEKYIKKVPILILAFNRPEQVKRAMEPVRKYQPERLYLACDGPRTDRSGEEALVAATQKAMLDAVDWDCTVKLLFREKNLGCAYAVYEAITWFFSYEEYGVIIEDDIIIGQDFFKLCEKLLPRYAGEERIMEIAAQNHSTRIDVPNSYVYTQTAHCWGWATWRRAWLKMDMDMKATQSLSLPSLIHRLGFFRGFMWYYYFKSAYRNLATFGTWDTRWYLSILDHDGFIISPGVNLAINIGFNGGTHYEKDDEDPYKGMVIGKMEWPLLYNDSLKIDKKQFKEDKRDFRRVRTIGIKKKLKHFL